MKNNSSLINVEKNKDCGIVINVNHIDDLSCDFIYNNLSDPKQLEKSFSERLDLSCYKINKDILPSQLKEDFEVEAKIVDGKLKYALKAKTNDAYHKFPLRYSYTMKFGSIEEANQFKLNGIKELQKKANITRKPVEVPNITKVGEFLKDIPNPFSIINENEYKGVRLYIVPKELPLAEEYSIEIFNHLHSFKINTWLKAYMIDDKNLILSNNESKNEAFNITIEIIDLDIMISNESEVEGKFSINLTLRKESEKDNFCNKELMKFRFLADDIKNNIIIKDIILNDTVFSAYKCGTVNYKQKDYNCFKKIIDLIDKVEYIAKTKKIKIDFDLNYFLANEEGINLLFNELNNQNYNFKKMMIWDFEVEEIDETEIYKHNGIFSIITSLPKITLFDNNFDLSSNQIIFSNCEIISITNKGNNNTVKIKPKQIKFKLLKK